MAVSNRRRQVKRIYQGKSQNTVRACSFVPNVDPRDQPDWPRKTVERRPATLSREAQIRDFLETRVSGVDLISFAYYLAPRLECH